MPRSSALKKSVVAGERHRPDVARRRAQWIKYQDRVEPERLVFIDETFDQDRYGALAGMGATRLQAHRHGSTRPLEDHDLPGRLAP